MAVPITVCQSEQVANSNHPEACRKWEGLKCKVTSGNYMQSLAAV